MPLAGRQITYDTAFARCYEVGWRSETLIDAVALMCAESGRYTGAWHDNLDADGNVDSTDRGLYQINNKWHPELLDEEAFQVRPNIECAHRIFVDWDRTFGAWMAYESGAYKKFLPYVTERYELGKWRAKISE